MLLSFVLIVILVLLIICIVWVNWFNVVLFWIKLLGVDIGFLRENGVIYCGFCVNWKVNFLNICVFIFFVFMVLFYVDSVLYVFLMDILLLFIMIGVDFCLLYSCSKFGNIFFVR